METPIKIYSDYIGTIKVLEVDLLLSNLDDLSNKTDAEKLSNKLLEVNYKTLRSYISSDKTKWVITGDTRLSNKQNKEVNHPIDINDFRVALFIDKGVDIKVIEFIVLDIDTKLSFVIKNNHIGLIFVDYDLIDKYKETQKLKFVKILSKV